ncbi:MAG: NAD(+) synthase [Verrucomicrobia bacterium]|nr:NAD(+) synthase [Verrucomicrobiota bacterium]
MSSPRIRAGAACLNQTPLDWPGNTRRILQAITGARAAGIDLLCLPELCITGYGCEDAFLSPAVIERAWQALQEIAPQTSGLAVAVGLPIFHRGGVYNAAALLVDGRITGLAAKQNLAGDGLHYEPRWFKPWPKGTTARIEPGGIPLGDLLFDLGGVRLGFEICEDAWVPDPPGIDLARRGLDIILNPSASHFAFGKQQVRKGFVLDNSRALGAGYIYANLVGNEAGRSVYDGGAMIAAGGRLLAEGPRLFFHDFHLTSAVIDLSRTRSLQSRIVSRDLDPGHAPEVAIPFSFAHPAPQPSAPLPTPEWTKEREFTHAVALGLFDYLRKSRSRGFVLSLSGGADSGAIACLVSLMQRIGTAELGEAGFREKLGGWLGPDPASWMKTLLVCVYQASENSGPVTEEAARGLAEAIGAEFHRWDIGDFVRGYSGLAASALGRELSWEQDDVALQNIQARVRAPGVWMLANLRGALLVSTSNRSEAAVGYATMDGDTCGGLSPIAGIDKAFLRHWLRWLELTGCPADGIDPIPVLSRINQQAPTAELRPSSRHQTDEDDLMPYPVLDAIERFAIRDKLPPAAVFEAIQVDCPGHEAPRLLAWVVRFFRLWSRNQWKRERYAPSFHLDDENLDPKTWCRFPILSGGFEEELRDLEGSGQLHQLALDPARDLD